MKNNYNKSEPKIYQSEYGTWKVRFYDDADGIYRNKSCRTKTEAENLKRAIARGDNLSHWFPNESEINESLKTFQDLAARWIEHGRHVRQISESCLMNYSCHLKNHIFPVFGQIELRKLKLDHLEKLAKELRIKKAKSKSYLAIRKTHWENNAIEDEDKLSLSYQREILTVACMITSWGFARRPPLIPDNPFETFKLPKTPEHLFDYWRLEEEDQFLDWIEAGGFYEKETSRYHHKGKKKVVIKLQIRNPQELRDIVLFALRTGMRLGEIGAIRNADVDLVRGFLIVRASYSNKEKVRKNTTKSKKARRIEINDDVREILMRKRHTPQKEPLFNIHMNSIKCFSRTCRWAGIKEIHFHSLRHTCLTNLANGYGMEKPLPVPKVQQIAGHSDIKTTMRYVHGDIINDTASRQWSRKDRLKQKSEDEQSTPKDGSNKGNEEVSVSEKNEVIEETIGNVVSIKKGLRLIRSSKN
ncbi:MAG: tyrosine-type recombinase/integrase [Oligoflexales bacterium]